MDEINKELTSKVIEGLSLEIQETSYAKEIAQLSGLVKELQMDKDRLEKAKNQVLAARDNITRLLENMKRIQNEALSAEKSANKAAEDAKVQCRDAEQWAKVAREPIDLDTPLGKIVASLMENQERMKKISQRITEIKSRREELKRDGIDISKPHARANIAL